MIPQLATLASNGILGGTVVFAAEQATDPLPNVVQYGILGVIVLALATGRFLVPRFVLDQANARAEHWEKEAGERVAQLVGLYQSNEQKVVPALIAAQSSSVETLAFMRDFLRKPA